MDGSLHKLAPVPLAANELVPQPRAERRREGSRFALAKGKPREGSVPTEPDEPFPTDLPVAPHAADEAGSHLDLTA